MAVALRVERDRLVYTPDGLCKRKARYVHFHLAVVDTAEREQVLHDAGHAVSLADDNAHKVVVQLRRQLVTGGNDGLGVGFDVGERCAQLMRNVCDKFPPCLFAAALLGDVVNDDHHAAGRLIGGIRRHEQLQFARADGFLRLEILWPLERKDLLEVRVSGENIGKAGRRIHRPRQHLRGCGVEVDDLPAGGECDHAVGHVQEERRKLVALIFDLGKRVLKHLRHVVEVPRQNADLVAARDLQLLREVARGDLTGADGKRADGRDEDLRQQERKHDADHKAQRQRLQNDVEHLAGQLVHRRLVVADVDDIALPVRPDGHSQIHIAIGDGAFLPHPAVHGRQDIGRDIDVLRLARAGQHVAGRRKDIHVASGNVDAKPGLCHQQLLHLVRRIRRLRRDPLELRDEVLREGLLHLDIEFRNIEVSDAIDEERANDGHERQDQDHKDHDQLHTERTHGSASFPVDSGRPGLPQITARSSSRRRASSGSAQACQDRPRSSRAGGGPSRPPSAYRRNSRSSRPSASDPRA